MIASERRRQVAELIAWSKALIAAAPLSQIMLAQILARLEALAARRAFWSEEEFAGPPPGEEGPLYLIAEEPDHRFAIYLNVLTPGMNYPPHNHTTWACVAAVSGCEENFLFDRLDDGKTEGRAQIRQVESVNVVPGHGIALMPNDIHAIANNSQEITRHLHFYGRALEVLTDRITFDAAAGTCERMALMASTPT